MQELSDELLLVIMQLNRKKIIAEKKDNITQSEMIILFHLSLSNYKLCASDFVNMLNFSKSMVTTIINNLVKKDLVERIYDSIDHRKCYIKLTAKGKKLVVMHNKEFHIMLDRVIKKIGLEETKKFILTAKKIMEV